ncbi:FtsX-like permease family protein [Cryomorpha ignava]|uniref:FtsX-like permease family protein n=1 Tax=Cryomorpha ignava TaxID=101383 RepID=A0A7K3WN22_9FLAO|nr:ABC transporter permease [Cryomorpha ignava]NEN23049.1 FtsX-like permease family protein [Cryomorpha ignava]
MKKFLIYIRLLREGATFAISALVVNRLRTSLSLLGITIGIFLIISVFTLVSSLEKSIRSSFETLGDDSIFIEKMPWGPEKDGEYAWWEYMQRPNVTFREARQLKERMNSAKAVTFLASTSRNLERNKNSSENTVIVAATVGFENFISVEVETGRLFTPMELESTRRVCILGSDVSSRLFGESEALGQSVKISGFSATVIGVLQKAGSGVIGGGTDEWCIVPVEFGRMIMQLDKVKTQIALKPKDLVSFEALENEVMQNMRSIRMLRPTEERNFAINKSSMLSNGLDELFAILNIAGLIIGGFSILVGGFSIANIMFVSVRERTNIIGIQKALGAKQCFILFQFLFESVALCVLGGVIGMLLIFLGSILATAITGFEVVLTLNNILIGLAFSVGIGLVSGVVPAYMAARLEPVEAMRSSG